MDERLRKQEMIDRWRARTLGTTAPPPTSPQDQTSGDAWIAPGEEYGPIDRFVPLLVAFSAGAVFGLGLAVLIRLR